MLIPKPINISQAEWQDIGNNRSDRFATRLNRRGIRARRHIWKPGKLKGPQCGTAELPQDRVAMHRRHAIVKHGGENVIR